MPLNPGEGVGAMSAEIGQSLTAMQWANFSNLLAPEEVQRLRDWWSSNPQTDQEAIGAMLRCVQVQKIAHAIGQVVTNDQGLQLDALLNKVYASMGVVRPTSSESVQPGPSGHPALTVVNSESAHRSGDVVAAVSQSTMQDSESSGADSQSANRSGNGAILAAAEDSESEDLYSDEDSESEDGESDEDVEVSESETNGASKSKKKTKASKSKKTTKASKSKATKKASASKSKPRGRGRPST